MNPDKFLQKKALLAGIAISEKQAMQFRFFLEFHKSIYCIYYKNSFKLYLMPDSYYGEQKRVFNDRLIDLLNEYFNK